MVGASKQPVCTTPLGLLSAASKTATECHGVLPGSYKRGHNHRTSHEAASVNDHAFTMKGQEYTEDKRVTITQGVAPFNHLCSSTFGAPSTHPRVLASASAALHNASEALSVCSPPPSVLKGASKLGIESPPDRKKAILQQQKDFSLHSLTGIAQHKMNKPVVHYSLHPDSQTLHIQQEPQAVCSQSLAASDGYSLDFTSGTTILGTPTNSECSKPTLDGENQQGSAVFPDNSSYLLIGFPMKSGIVI